ncbi:A/G-specific adenine glycosylase|nr:A/G-specific adenine glycosylase [Dendrosporobacter quercicolus DSM 1736]
MALIVQPLLAWYDANARILPWREQPTPYHVWISEIMLQQTRVEAVKPYFDRFIRTLPDIAALAHAPVEQLLKLWEGLGYYSRARNLQKAAGLMLDKYGGELPRSYEELRTLPGIGPYTAGAIASIAYGIPVPAVDGNVLRVVARLTACSEDIGKESVKKQMAGMLKQILPDDRTGDFNQALMELGAMICLPRGVAKCASCPVAGLCRARELDIVTTLPVKAAQKARRQEQKTVFVILAQGRVALKQRPAKGLLAGLWELPNENSCLTTAKAQELLALWGVRVDAIHKLPAAKHVFTHLEWQMTGYAVYAANCTAGLIWLKPEQLTENLALPTAFKPYTEQIGVLLATQH